LKPCITGPHEGIGMRNPEVHGASPRIKAMVVYLSREWTPWCGYSVIYLFGISALDKNRYIF